jgi:tetratricopeptide (TPR) repeat protein
MAELRAGLGAALAGRTQIFLLTGEAGIGKTRLASEIAAEAESRGMRVVWGRCCEAAGAPPFWPITIVARTLTEGLDPQRLGAMVGPAAAAEIARFVGEPAAASNGAREDDAEQARFRVFDSFATLLASSARANPLMLIFDDLHDADETSWLMLRFAVREIHDAPLMIVAAYRDFALRGSDALSRAIADLYRSGRQLPLAGLSEAEVAQVVAGGAGQAPDRRFVSALHRSTGGNPFFISEVIRAMNLDGESPALGVADGAEYRVPESVRTSIGGRLSALEAPAREMLRAAAALGSQFDAGPLERVTGLAPAALLRALDRAITAGIIAPDGPGRYRFCHALIREVVYHDQDLAARARLHAEIVSALEELYCAEPSAHLDQIAFHAVAAAPVGSSEKAIEYTTAAAEAAFRAFAYEQAARQLQSALTLAERGPANPRRLARILERLGDACSITEFDQPRGIECIERAAKIYESIAMPVEGAHLRARLGVMLARRSPAMNLSRAMAQYRLAETVLRAEPESQAQIWLYTGLAQAAMQAQHTHEGLAASRRAMDIAAHLGEESLWIRAAAQHSDHLFNSGRLAEAAALTADAWDRADRRDDLDGGFETAWSGGYHRLALWDPREAQRWFRRELGRPRMAQAEFQRRVLIQHIAFSYVFRGQLDRASEMLADSPRALVEGVILYYRGQWERAAELLDESREAMRAAGSRDGEAVYSFYQGLVCLAAGDLEGAQQRNHTTLQAVIEGPHIPYALNGHAQAALIALTRDRFDTGREHLARCRDIIAGGEDFRGLFGRAAMAEAAVAAAEGGHDIAERHFTRALEIFQRYDLPWDRAQTHHLWGAALLKAGALSRASEQFDAALAIYNRCGAGAPRLDKIAAARGGAASIDAAATNQAAAGLAPSTEGVFRSEGDYWLIAMGGVELRLRSTKGLLYLAHLIARPGQSIAVAEMARIGATVIGQRVRRRADDDGGYGQQAGHARVMVTKAIKAAIRKIRDLDISLGHHLATSIHTGYSCVYEPDPIHPVRWQVSEPPRIPAKPRP